MRGLLGRIHTSVAARFIHRPRCRFHRLGQTQLDARVLDLLTRRIEVEDSIETGQQPARRLVDSIDRVIVARKQHVLHMRRAPHESVKGGSHRAWERRCSITDCMEMSYIWVVPIDIDLTIRRIKRTKSAVCCA